MPRISVVGSSGSGKTTMARALAKALALPHLELDSIYHQPNWTPLSSDEFRARVAGYCEQASWVIDGNYNSHGVLDIVWTHANMVVWLDPPKRVVMRRVIWRSLLRVFTGKTLWNGNRERLANLLRTDPNENVVLWAFTRFATVRERYSERSSDPAWAHLQVHRLCTERDHRAFLATLDRR